MKFVIKEPIDGSLNKLSEDEEFKAIVLRACEDSHIRLNDVSEDYTIERPAVPMETRGILLLTA